MRPTVTTQRPRCSENCPRSTVDEDEDLNKEITYKIDDVPPWYVCLVLSFQHYLTMLGGTVSYPYLVCPHLCISEDDPTRGYIVSTTFFVSGICTFLQSTFGVRLPIVQGSSMAFLVPIFAIMNLPEWQCPPMDLNSTLTIEERREIWMPRMREVQGAIIGASVCEVAIGFFGIMGFLLNWITPLAIVPTISLVGLSLFAEAAHSASGNWGISMLTMLLMILFSQCLRDVCMPYPTYNEKTGWTFGKFPLFKLFPVLLTILMSWSLCAILTATGVFSEENPARTDSRLSILRASPWIRIPYPGQWGMPTFTSGAMVGVLAGVLASAIESVGDYYACARLSGAESPPKHAINRGILIEGIGCIVAGLFGTASGTTSFSENIGAIGITKVASRRVIQYGSILMIMFGMLGKFGAIFVTIPGPILGGIFCIMFSMITAVGLSTLHFVDLNSSRNLFVLGFSIFMGLCLPKWIQSNPEFIDTGNQAADQALTILLSTNMLVGGFIGFLMDNIIPGTDKERGLIAWRKQGEVYSSTSITLAPKTYNIPGITSYLEKHTMFNLLPISPTYQEGSLKSRIVVLKEYFSRKKQPTERNEPI
nr:solute carrier family 23 member 2 isoform X2 [Parasteatoda tepidariorum]